MIRTLMMSILLAFGAPALAVTAIPPVAAGARPAIVTSSSAPARQASIQKLPAADPIEIAAAVAGLLIVLIAFATGRRPWSVSA